VLAAVMLLLVGMAIILSRRVVEPILTLSTTIATVAQDNLDVNVPYRTRRDEIGQMAKAIDKLRIGAAEAAAFARTSETERASALRAVRGDLSSRFSDEFAVTLADIRKTAAAIRMLSQSSADLAEDMKGGTQEARSEIAELTHRLASIAGASEELASAIASVSHEAEEASALTVLAADEARVASGRVAELTEISGRIDEVVVLIRSVAEQTNLLALNATIEAARAGEAGRGFAVVAAEVKGLAQQTSSATEEISRKIAEMRAVIAQSVESITRIGEAVPQIASGSAAISAAMMQQRTTTGEISRDVSQAAERAELLVMTTAKSLTSVELAATAAKDVLRAMDNLDQQGSIIEQRTGEFAARITA
jgi:methyl-accepting chemotaxis protein